MTTTIRLYGGSFGSDQMFVRCNLHQASAPVQVLYELGETNWESTQYQCADCRHYVSGLVAKGKELAAQAIGEPEESFDCEWEQVTGFVNDADVSHEDARDWYGSYGWHISTENAGDVTHEAVEYDWLDDSDDDTVVEKLLASDDKLTAEEAESIVAKARSIRESGESIEALLVEAVEAYQREDYAACVAALDSAKEQEDDHGDCPASNTLRGQLIDSDYAEVLN